MSGRLTNCCGIAVDASDSTPSCGVTDGSVTRKYGGTGLGLAICRRLVELMGGEIDAVSVEGQGSTFWFTAQIGRSRSAPDAARPRRADLLNLRALVVDDRQTNQDILLSYLRAWGHAANCVAGGVAALAALRRAAATQTPYDLVITDLVMPEMDGFTLGRAIQCDPAIAGTRLILLTAFDDRGQGEQAIQSGFGAYLTKPVKQSQLFDAIANVIADDRWLTPNQEPLPAAGDQSPDTTGDGQPMMDDRLMDDRRRANQLILVVEDNAVNQRLALRQLERLGYPAQVASNGREALEAVTSAAQPYALVLMDCQMPVMDGFAASRAIREWEHGGGSRIPIVAMTANAVQGDREVCLAAGMDDYLSKPVRRDDLRRVLEGWLAPAASAPDATEAPAESPLDRSILEGLRELQAPGEDGLLGELIDLFVADAHIQIAAMQSAIERGDPPALARAAHQFKGSSANLGATALAGRCAELEALGKMQMIAGAVALLRSAEHEFERARRALEVERRAMWS